jgi:hypothetical protein
VVLAALAAPLGAVAADVSVSTATLPAPSPAVGSATPQYGVGGSGTTGGTPAAVAAAVAAAPQAPPEATSPPSFVHTTPPKRGPRHLLRPRVGAVLVAGRTLTVSWRRDPRARYYNLQLYRGRRKVVSAWPTARRLTVRRTTMRAGRYALVIWSGVGPKARARYARPPWVGQALRVRARPV